jgi:predicted phage-related endonuclease
MYPESGESVRVVSGDEETEVNGLVDTRLGGKEQLAQIEKEIESAENRLRQLCGEDGYIQTGQYKVSWKSQGKSKVNTEKMKTDGIYETYVERGTTRVLRTTSNQRREQ